MQINILIICNIINNNIIKVFKVKIKGKEDYKLGFKNGSAGLHSHLNYQSYLSIVFFLLIQVKDIMFLLNSHQAITLHKNIIFSRFTLMIISYLSKIYLQSCTAVENRHLNWSLTKWCIINHIPSFILPP